MVGNKNKSLKSKAKNVLDKIINKKPKEEESSEVVKAIKFKKSKDTGKFVYTNPKGKRIFRAPMRDGNGYVFFRGKPLLINPKFEDHIETLRTFDCLTEV